MPPRFEFPLSYMESMMPNAAVAHETVTADAPQDAPQDYGAAALNELLASLENPTIPQPQQPKKYQRVLGALGDALGSMASVRAGGGPVPVGPFAANLQAQQRSYEQQTREAEQGRIDTRNKVRIGAFEEGLRAKREKEVAATRAANQRLMKSEFTRDVNGEPHTFQRWHNAAGETVLTPNPETGEMEYEHDLGPRGYAPAIVPGTIQTDEGPKARILKVPRGGSGRTTAVTGPGGETVEPPTPPALAAETGGKVGVLQGIPHLREVFDRTDADVRGTGELAKWKNWGIAQTAGTRFQSVAMPASLQNYYNEVRGILAPYVRSVSGLVFPDAELRRYEARMPIPGVTPPESVDTAWNSLIAEMVRDIKAKYGAAGREAPALPSGAAPPSAQPSTDLQEWLRQRNVTVEP